MFLLASAKLAVHGTLCVGLLQPLALRSGTCTSPRRVRRLLVSMTGRRAARLCRCLMLDQPRGSPLSLPQDQRHSCL